MTGAVKAIDARVNGVQVTAKPNPKANDGVLATISSMWSHSKNIADLLGLMSKGAKLLGSLVPESVVPWTSHIESGAGDARKWMAPGYFPTVVKKFTETYSFRDGIETIKIGGFSVAAIIPNRTIAGKIADGAGLAGVALDAVDLTREIDAHNTCASLSNVPVTGEVRKILDNQLWISTCKILKLCLTIFAGLVAAAACLGFAVCTPLATAALVASLGALILSFTVVYTEHTAQWTTKIARVPIESPV